MKLCENPNAKLVARNLSKSGKITRMRTSILSGNNGSTYPITNVDFVENNGSASVYYKFSKIGFEANILKDHFGVGDVVTVNGTLYETQREWNGNQYIDNVFDETSRVNLVTKRQSNVTF